MDLFVFRVVANIHVVLYYYFLTSLFWSALLCGNYHAIHITLALLPSAGEQVYMLAEQGTYIPFHEGNINKIVYFN